MLEFISLLAAIDDDTLEAVLNAIEQLPGMLPALQAWVDHAARWEFDRRSGIHYPLQPPMAAISSDELPAALADASLAGDRCGGDRSRDVPVILAFFDRLYRALQSERQRAGAALH